MSAGGAGAAAAAAKRRRERAEEETMTSYGGKDLEGWEFKFLRSPTGAFKNPESFSRALQEEARAGWELVEKFDNGRVRLKRPVSARAGDAGLGFDAYRTNYGLSEGKFVALILGCVFGGIALLVAIAATLAHR